MSSARFELLKCHEQFANVWSKVFFAKYRMEGNFGGWKHWQIL